MKTYRFTLWQGGMKVVGVQADDEGRGIQEIMHYAAVYEQDGPVIAKQGNRIIYRTPEPA